MTGEHLLLVRASHGDWVGVRRGPGTASRESAKRGDDSGGRHARKLPARATTSLTLARPGGGPPESPAAIRIGVISDNHGYLDPAVLQVFAGVAHIIHAGDIMDPAILASLETVAPVTAVAGNLDTGELAERLPREASGEVAGMRFLVGHKPKRLLNRLSSGSVADKHPDLVVWGHTHVPSAAWVDGALYLNPGTASSPDEEDDGPTVAVVEVEPAGLSVKFVPLPRRAEAAEIGRVPRLLV